MLFTCVRAAQWLSLIHISLALVVVMLARHPAVVAPRVVDLFQVVELPHDIAVVVDLDQVYPSCMRCV